MLSKAAVVPVKSPVKLPPDRGSLLAMFELTVVAKFGSSPNAAASSFSVSSAAGEESTRLLIAVATYV